MIDQAPTAAWLDHALAAVTRDRVAGIARALVDTPSPTGSERACAERLQACLGHPAMTLVLDPFADGRANVLAGLLGSRPGPRLLLLGHLDTTGYGDERDRAWLHNATPGDRPVAHVEDGILSGLGAYNMKGGVAAAAEALLAIASVADRLSGEIWVAGVAGESEKAQVRGLARDFNGPDYLGGGIGADRLLATGPKVDAVVVCEPSGLTVVNAQPGYLLTQLRVLGRSRYLPSPADPTAIKGLAAVIAALEAWAATYADRAAIDCGTGILRPTTTIGAVEAGAPYKPGGAPDAAALYLDVRVPPGLDADDLVAEIRATAAGALGSHGPTSGLTLETEVFARNVPGAITPVDHPLVQAAQQARTSTLGLPTERVPDADLTAGDDGKVFARAGIPYVKIGPGSATGRDPRFGREQVRIDDLEMAARIYVELAARLTEPSHDFALTPSRTMGPSPGIGSRMA